MKHLTSIANLCNTDKGTTFFHSHGFIEFYDDIFNHYKGKKVNILEIGVDEGASLLMYNAFFDGECNIFAIDIEDKTKYDSENVKTFIVNQGSKEEIEEFKKKIGDIKFDIILDDGSHFVEDQVVSFYYLNDLLNEDGVYIIEDLHTFVWDDIEKSPLYSLMFDKPFCVLSKEESDILHSKIDNIQIFGRKNDKISHIGTDVSLTSVIRMK